MPRWDNINVDDSRFKSTNTDYQSWKLNNEDFFNKINQIYQYTLTSLPIDEQYRVIANKIVVEHLIPTDELMSELNNQILDKTIQSINLMKRENLRDHLKIEIEDRNSDYFDDIVDSDFNRVKLNKSYDGILDKTTNTSSDSTPPYFNDHYVFDLLVSSNYSYQTESNGKDITRFLKLRPFESIVNYDDLKKSLNSSDAPVNYNQLDYERIKHYYDLTDWNNHYYDTQMFSNLKAKMAKNIELYEIIEKIKHLQKINPEKFHDEIETLKNNAKQIVNNDSNLFLNKTQYIVDKNALKNYLTHSLEQLKESGKQVDKINIDFILSQIEKDPSLLKNISIDPNDSFNLKKNELDDKKRKDLLELAKKQIDLLEKLGGDLSEYRESINNNNLTDEQIKELNERISHPLKNGISNTTIGYKNFNGGSRAHIVGAENIVLSQESGVIGNNNNLSREATNTFVLGSNVTTNIPNSVALGKDTTLSAPIATPSHTIAGTQYNFAGIAPVGTVSIGAEGKERILTNLAAGRISNTSTDGINGSQLNAVIETLNGLSTELTTLKNAPKGGKTVIKAGDGLSLTEGDDGSITLSNTLTFNSGNGMAVNKEGNNITITNTKPFEGADKEKLNNASTSATSALEKSNTNEGAINTTNSKITDLSGKVTTVTNTANEALEKANQASKPTDLVAGKGIQVTQDEDGRMKIASNLVAGEGVDLSESNGNTVVKSLIDIQAGKGINVNKNGNVFTISSVGNEIHKLEITGDDRVIHEVAGALSIVGDENIETNTQGGKVNVKLKKNIQVDSLKVGGNLLTQGGLKIGNTIITDKGSNMGNQVIDGVANGEISPNSQQVINGSQIYEMSRHFGENINNLQQQISSQNERMEQLNRENQAGIANVVAMANLPQATLTGRSMISAAVGTHKNARAVSVGVSRLSDNQKLSIKFSASTSVSKGKATVSAGAGVGLHF